MGGGGHQTVQELTHACSSPLFLSCPGLVWPRSCNQPAEHVSDENEHGTDKMFSESLVRKVIQETRIEIVASTLGNTLQTTMMGPTRTAMKHACYSARTVK